MEGRAVIDDARCGRPSTPTTDENIEAVKKKWFWIIVESVLERLLMMLAYCSVHAK